MSENEKATFLVDKELKDNRLDIVITNNLNSLSRSAVQKLIKEGNVCIGDKVIREKNHKVNLSDLITVSIPVPNSIEIKPENIPLEIIYEDDFLLVVNKPKGMVVHPAIGNYSNTLVNALLYHTENLSDINGKLRPGIVHRIDKDTSGLLMVAKTNEVHISLAKQLKEHSTNRKYMALVHNGFKEEEGVINKPIGRDPKNRLKRTVTDINSKEAVTYYKVLERLGKFTLIEAKLKTGRTHQIRVHMSYINHALVGDSLYGNKKETINCNGQMLHARLIGFKHPITAEYMEFENEPPKEFLNIINRVRDIKDK